jgi:methylmalonyl-CoA/ethylmalonyl-CoA epimerase
MRRIDHIGIAVEDLEAALVPYVEGLGMEVAHREEVPEERVRVAMLPVGETKIELLEPTDPESPIARFIGRRGQGIHHIALAVDDVGAALESLKAGGRRDQGRLRPSQGLRRRPGRAGRGRPLSLR